MTEIRCHFTCLVTTQYLVILVDCITAATLSLTADCDTHNNYLFCHLYFLSTLVLIIVLFIGVSVTGSVITMHCIIFVEFSMTDYLVTP